MGTNYYIDDGHQCIHCGHPIRERTHIGKNSSGWKFLFNGQDFKTKREWFACLQYAGPEVPLPQIVDEYGQTIDFNTFASMVKSRQLASSHVTNSPRSWCDDEGYNFYDGEFC